MDNLRKEIDAEETYLTLRDALRDQEKEMTPKSRQKDYPALGYNIFILFNLQAAVDQGHASIGICKKGGFLKTYSYYRPDESQLRAPAKVARQLTDYTFDDLIKNSGWLMQGVPEDKWNEHMDSALAIQCSKWAYEKVYDYCEKMTANPGIYDLLFFNCLHFVNDALECAGITLLDRFFKPIHTIIPKNSFKNVRYVLGAMPYGDWKYWFEATKPPVNDLRTIADAYEERVKKEEEALRRANKKIWRKMGRPKKDLGEMI
ncbi:MAG: hypothetical protein LUB61_05015 [Eggerthellaceae bacterium]|nr:hypothetical protein [Eggerthellaceae bacterium]